LGYCAYITLHPLHGLISISLVFPVQDAIRKSIMSTNGGYNLGGINSTGQIMEGVFALVDKDTPQDVQTKVSPVDGRNMQLVFSDEFNQDNRTFWPVSGIPLTRTGA
jgi:beta-glucan synthesis-associated protein KRE6